MDVRQHVYFEKPFAKRDSRRANFPLNSRFEFWRSGAQEAEIGRIWSRSCMNSNQFDKKLLVGSHSWWMSHGETSCPSAVSFSSGSNWSGGGQICERSCDDRDSTGQIQRHGQYSLVKCFHHRCCLFAAVGHNQLSAADDCATTARRLPNTIDDYRRLSTTIDDCRRALKS